MTCLYCFDAYFPVKFPCALHTYILVIRTTFVFSFLYITDPVLQFLLAGLQQPQLATVAANSLQNICSQCRTQMADHFNGLLQIVEAMDTFNVSNDAAIGLLKGKI